MEANIFDGCLVTEELAYGCTGIVTAIETTSLGVSFITNSIYFLYHMKEETVKIFCSKGEPIKHFYYLI